jgi:cell division transport system permease protein
MTSLERAWRGARNDWRLHLLSVFSVAVAFVCLAASLVVVFNVYGIRQRWQSTGRVSVYLAPKATEEQVRGIESALRQSSSVAEVRRVSSEQAQRELAGDSPDPIVTALPVEAFPASLEVSLSESSGHGIDKLAAQLGALPAVESVETYQSWVERLARVVQGGVTASAILALVIFGSVVSVVSSTIRLALHRRQVEVDVLKLVGATDDYVRRPFVVEGAVQGALGAAAGTVFLALLFSIIRSRCDAAFGALMGCAPVFLPWWIAVGLVIAGAALGAAAAFISLSKSLGS